MRHTRQPQTVTPIDGSNPTARSIGLLAVPGLPELVQKRAQIVSGNYTVTPGPAGKGALGPATQLPGYVGYDLRVPLLIAGDFTVAFLASASQIYGGGYETHIAENIGPLGLNSLRLGSTSVEVVLDGTSSGTVAWDFTRPSLIVARRIGSTAELRINNTLMATWATSARIGAITGLTLGRYRVGDNTNSDINGNQTAVYLAAIAARAWTPAEITRFSANPWGVFRFPTRRLAAPPARFALSGRPCAGGAANSVGVVAQHQAARGAVSSSSVTSTGAGVVSHSLPVGALALAVALAGQGAAVQHQGVAVSAGAGTASSPCGPVAQHQGALGGASTGKAGGGQGAVASRHSLTGTVGVERNVSSDAGLAQHHTPAGTIGASRPASTSAGLLTRVEVIGSAGAGGATAAVGGTAQHHVANTSADAQANRTDSSALTVVRAVLVSPGGWGALVISGPGVAQHQGLAAMSSTGFAIGTQGVLVQLHHARGAETTQAASAGAGILTPIRLAVLSPVCWGAPTGSHGAGVQVQRLTASDGVQSADARGGALAIINYEAPLGRMWRAPATSRFRRIS